MPSLESGKHRLTVQEGQRLLQDLGNRLQAEKQAEKQGSCTPENLPVRIKAGNDSVGRRVEVYLGEAKESWHWTKTTIPKTAKQQVHARVLTDRLQVRPVENTDFFYTIPCVDIPNVEQYKKENIQVGCKHQSNGQLYKVVSCSEFHKSLSEWITEKSKVEKCQSYINQMHRYCDSSCRNVQEGTNTREAVKLAKLLWEEDEAFWKKSMEENPDLQYFIRQALALSVKELNLKSADEITKFKHLLLEAGVEGQHYVESLVQISSYDSALKICKALWRNPDIGDAILKGFIAHHSLLFSKPIKNDYASWLEWGNQVAKSVHEMLKDTGIEIDKLEKLSLHSQTVLDAWAKRLQVPKGVTTEQGFKAYKEEIADAALLASLKDASDNLISSFQKEESKARAEIATMKDLSGDPDIAFKFTQLPEYKCRKKGDINNLLKAESYGQPSHPDVPTPPYNAVWAGGTNCYPGNIVALTASSYMAMQGPNAGNIDHYLNVLLTHNVQLSVSLAENDEGLFPEAGSTIKTSAGHIVKNLHIHTLPLKNGLLEIHHLMIDGKAHRRIRVRNVPESEIVSPELLTTISMLAQGMTKKRMEPIAVNCTDGLGYTGTLIAAMEILKRMAKSTPLETQDQLGELIVAMREQRGPHTVETSSQYAVLEQILRNQGRLFSAFQSLKDLEL